MAVISNVATGVVPRMTNKRPSKLRTWWDGLSPRQKFWLKFALIAL